MKFEAVVGNPPYQEEIKRQSKNNNQNPRKNIFHLFQIIAEKIAESQTVLIYPGIRWMHQSGKGLKQFGLDLINNLNLEKIIFYPNAKDVFYDSGIPDGISIVHLNKKQEKDEFVYEYREKQNSITLNQKKPKDSLLIIDPQDISIAQKIQNFVDENNISFLHKNILPRSLFGIESDFIDNNKSNVKIWNEYEPLRKDEIKIFTNDKSGPAGRTKWFVLNKTLLPKHNKYLEEWQVVVSSAHAGGQEGRDNQLEIIDNKSVFGRARVALKSFTTKREAINFYKYCQSKIVKYAFLLSDESLTSLAKFVPDLNDYLDSQLIDFSKNIDLQLYKKLNLSQEEIEFIEQKIKPME